MSEPLKFINLFDAVIIILRQFLVDILTYVAWKLSGGLPKHRGILICHTYL